MTLDGTNSWLLAEPGARVAAVVDPGPDDEGHLARLAGLAAERGQRIGLILLTHRHGDHSAGAGTFSALTAAPIRGWHRSFAAPLADGERLDIGGLLVDVVATPGHTSDSVSFHLPADRALLTGDTVLGRGSSAVLHPDGRVADMLTSLRRLRDLAAEAGTVILPGHGPVVVDPVPVLDRLLAARYRRVAEVRRAVADGEVNPDAIVRSLYSRVDPLLHRVARASVEASLHYLDVTDDPLRPSDHAP
jgi:glyoxylase-like metal-dependent hydrolase (beta-lactamase superfamily II)